MIMGNSESARLVFLLFFFKLVSVFSIKTEYSECTNFPLTGAIRSIRQGLSIGNKMTVWSNTDWGPVFVVKPVGSDGYLVVD